MRMETILTGKSLIYLSHSFQVSNSSTHTMKRKGESTKTCIYDLPCAVIEEIERMTLNHRKCSTQECMKSRHYVVLLDLKFSILICLFVLVQSS